jgi:hypothetical protein
VARGVTGCQFVLHYEELRLSPARPLAVDCCNSKEYAPSVFSTTVWTNSSKPPTMPDLQEGIGMENRLLSGNSVAAYLGIKRDMVCKWINRRDMHSDS